LKKFADWWDLDINQITPDMIRQRMIDLTTQMSRPNANKHLVALKSVLEMAVNDGLLGRNPCRGIRFFPVEKTVKFVPSKDQIAQALLLALAIRTGIFDDHLATRRPGAGDQ
jgi:hypothetical protein